VTPALLPFDIPVDVGRDQARELARQELLDPVYAAAQPPWWQRATSWVLDRLTDLLGRLGGAADSWLWLVVLAAVVALVAFVIVRRTGGLQRSRAARGRVFADLELTAHEHRLRAASAAAREDWGEGVREGFRAIVRQLEERGALDPRPGRTADEAARDGGLVFPSLGEQLAAAARSFDAVVYGNRPGSRAEYELIGDLDDLLTRTPQVVA
jgi:hypothetical protein